MKVPDTNEWFGIAIKILGRYSSLRTDVSMIENHQRHPIISPREQCGVHRI